ncbi:MAG: tyrosine-type recombinase/integrase [Flavobacteriales bacterium]|nr:tyrosine-type recombinase/integrase [Flavobacteriales bacterium]
MIAKKIPYYTSYLKSEKRYSFHTIISYENDLNQFCLFNEHQSFTRKNVRNWVVHLMKSECSPKTIHRKLSALRSFANFGITQGYFKVNPVNGLALPKIPKRLPVFCGEEDLITLLDHFECSDEKDIRNRLILELLYCTGIRRNELINIRVADLDLVSNEILIRGKGNKQRKIPLLPEIKKTIQNYLNIRSDSVQKSLYLFEIDGKPLYPKLVYRIVNEYLQNIGTLTKKSPHTLRHTFATHLLNRGADLNSIKELLGHASLASTQVYTHNSIEKLKSIYKLAHPRA